MKKILIILTAFMLFVLVACGDTASSAESDNETAASVDESVVEPSYAQEEEIVITEEESSVTVNQRSGTEGTPFSANGRLSVDGANLVNQHGDAFQLYGMSTHGLAWFPQYVNYEGFRTLRDDWNTNCIRLALYTAENGGYCVGGNQEALKNLVINGVDYATELGMYVIIDWHVLNDRDEDRRGDPNIFIEEAKEFFAEMSERYKDYDNVLYEICNEPNGRSTTWEVVTNYADEIIPIIRANNPNAVIIVGTPTWSQEIHRALESPLDYDNIMYALHFYAATHTEWLRERVENCVENGLPVFISEFAICDASGNGGNDYAQGQLWMQLIERYNLSYIAWNLANKAESSSVFASGSVRTSDWTEDDLSDRGKWIVEYFRNETSG